MKDIPTWIWVFCAALASIMFIFGFLLGAFVNDKANLEARARRDRWRGLDESGLEPGTKPGAIGKIKFANGTSAPMPLLPEEESGEPEWPTKKTESR